MDIKMCSIFIFRKTRIFIYLHGFFTMFIMISYVFYRLKLLFFFLSVSIISIKSQEAKNEYKDIKLGHRFYLKTEVLNSLLRMAFAPKTYDWDVQGTVMISNKVHWVSTYGKSTYNILDSVPSTERKGFVMIQHRKGEANNRFSSMIRYYPFQGFKTEVDYLFIEAGFHFQHYNGSTDLLIHDSLFISESQLIHELDFYRLGPQVNFGISQRFFNWDVYTSGNSSRKLKRISFSPEAFIGVYYNGLKIFKDEYTQVLGITEYDNSPYSESKIRLILRAKIGIGLF